MVFVIWQHCFQPVFLTFRNRAHTWIIFKNPPNPFICICECCFIANVSKNAFAFYFWLVLFWCNILLYTFFCVAFFENINVCDSPKTISLVLQMLSLCTVLLKYVILSLSWLCELYCFCLVFLYLKNHTRIHEYIHMYIVFTCLLHTTNT